MVGTNVSLYIRNRIKVCNTFLFLILVIKYFTVSCGIVIPSFITIYLETNINEVSTFIPILLWFNNSLQILYNLLRIDSVLYLLKYNIKVYCGLLENFEPENSYSIKNSLDSVDSDLPIIIRRFFIKELKNDNIIETYHRKTLNKIVVT